MSLTKPVVTEAEAKLNANSDIKDIEKALGFGAITTDNAMMIQGQAFTTESLSDDIMEYVIQESDFEVLNSIGRSQAGNIIDQWPEVYSIGHNPGKTVSNADGMSKQGTSAGHRRYVRLKFFTSQWGVNLNVTDQANFMQEFNKEDIRAANRMRSDYSWLLYEGNSSFSNAPGEPKAGNEFDGLKAIINDPEYYSYFADGPLIYDCHTQGSGLDSNGLSNPKDIENGVFELAKRMSMPANRMAQSAQLWMGQSVAAMVQKYQNFEPILPINGQPQDVIKGAYVAGFANAFTKAKATRFNTDPFLPDMLSTNNFMIPASVRGHAVPAVAPTLAAAPAASATDSFFNAGWDGNYFYAVVPFGMNISDDGYEGQTTVSAAVAVTVGGKVTLTITRGVGGKEDGYLIYRSERNGVNDPSKMRLLERVKAEATTTVYTDLNRKLPGASDLYIVDFADSAAVSFRYLYNPIRTPLPLDPRAGRVTRAFLADSIALRSIKHRSLGLIRGFNADATFSPKGK